VELFPAQVPRWRIRIPSDISKIDITGHGRIDRLYVGDMGGQMWRFDVGDSDPANWTGKIIFKSNGQRGCPRERSLSSCVVLERDSVDYEMIFFGTGDGSTLRIRQP